MWTFVCRWALKEATYKALNEEVNDTIRFYEICYLREEFSRLISSRRMHICIYSEAESFTGADDQFWRSMATPKRWLILLNHWYVGSSFACNPKLCHVLAGEKKSWWRRECDRSVCDSILRLGDRFQDVKAINSPSMIVYNMNLVLSTLTIISMFVFCDTCTQNIQASISHDGDYAIAFVVATSPTQMIASQEPIVKWASNNSRKLI